MRKFTPVLAALALCACGVNDPPKGYTLLAVCNRGPDLWVDATGRWWVGYSFDHASFAPVAAGAKMGDLCK